MTPNLVLCILAGALVAVGVYLLLERSLSRALLGIILFGNGANLLFLVASGRAGQAPIVGRSVVAAMSDPLPQAMVLTAIVITLGMTAFLLAMAHRSWQLARSDDVEDDTEDARIHDLAERNDMSGSEFADSADTSMESTDPDDGPVVAP